MTKFAKYFGIEKALNSLGADITRDEMVSTFTNGKKTGLSSLTYFEYNEFTNWMQEKLNSAKGTVSKPKKEFDVHANNMRRKIIALFAQMGYKTPDGKSDMERINAWCIKYSQYHKTLSEYSINQLPQLVTQVEKVYQSFINNL